ncbi:MAG: hypothetical protein KBT02_02785 [Treponema sp.]|nr:hypothetical protein [Candidatus Treponema caballi]
MKRIFCILLVLSLCLTSVFAFDFDFSQTEMSDLIGDYSKDIVYALPAAVSADNIWADAYIGQLISIPPHVAVGINLGGSFMGNNKMFENIGKSIGLPILSYLPGAPVPDASFDARIGGLFLDFDIGVHGSFFRVDMEDMDFLNGSVQVNSYGIDFRYCILTQKLIIPAISIGIGYDHVSTDALLTMTSEAAQLGFTFKTNADLLSATAQTSWNLLFMKLFAGARGMLPLGDGITSHTEFSATAQGASATFNPIDAVNKDLSIHVFGGIAFRLFVIDTTLGATYDITNKDLGISWSTRVQL